MGFGSGLRSRALWALDFIRFLDRESGVGLGVRKPPFLDLFSAGLAGLESPPMGVNAFLAVIVRPIAKWVLT